MMSELEYSEYSGYELDRPSPPPSNDKINVYEYCEHKRKDRNKYATLKKQDSDLPYETVTHSDSGKTDSDEILLPSSTPTRRPWGEWGKRVFWITLVVASLVFGFLGFSLAVGALSNRSSPTSTTIAACDCQTEVWDLQLAIDQLRAQVEELSLHQSTFISRVNDSFSATLTDVELYRNCNTTEEASCTVPVGSDSPGFSQCETTPVSVNTPEDYITDVKCVRTDTSAESNPVVVTLQRDELQGTACCQCYVVVPSNMTQTMEITCGLFITRCASQQNISSSTIHVPSL